MNSFDLWSKLADDLAKKWQYAMDVECHKVLQTMGGAATAYGSVGPGTTCLHYCKCGRIGEHKPNTYNYRIKIGEDTDGKVCHLPLTLRCNNCRKTDRHFWYRFKWRDT